MRISWRVLAILWALGSTGGSLASPQANVESADCTSYLNAPIPKYKVAVKYRTDLRPMLILQISISKETFNREDLLALACGLGRKFHKEDDLSVRIFDSQKAAKQYDETGEGVSTDTYFSYRAEYGFLRESRNHSLRWRPSRSDRYTWVEIFLGEPPPKAAQPTRHRLPATSAGGRVAHPR